MAAADADVEALQRVLTRLALTEDDKLESILDKLLPAVLGKMNGASQPVQQKILSILSHVNTRLQAAPTVALPLDALCSLYASSPSPLARNLALVYIERGAERADAEGRLRLVPSLLAGVSNKPPAQQAILLRLAASGTEALMGKTAPPTAEEAAAFAASHPFLAVDADRAGFLDFALRFVLYVPSSTKGPSSALQAAQQAAQQQGGGNTAPAGDAPAPPPPGLSRDDVAAVEGKPPPLFSATLNARKLGLLNFTAAAGVAPSEVLSLYLAAASDPSEAVSRRGDELLKKRCAIDAARPPVDVERPEILEPLFRLFHGSLDDESLRPEARRAPAGPALRARLLTLFCKSTAAANAAPWAMMTVTATLFGGGTTPRLQQQGMEFAVWMMKHADPAALAPAAPAVLDSCLSLLDASPPPPAGAAGGIDASTAALRSFAYQAIGHLAQRLPAALKGRTDLAARCFSALAAEPPGVRAAVAEATASLAAAFEDRDPGADEELLELLEKSVEAHQDAVRGAAVTWAVRLFPFSHPRARYICILGAADSRIQLAAAAREGLDPVRVAAKQRPRSEAATSAAAALALLPYPALPEMLAFLRARHPGLRNPVEEGRRLVLPAKSYVAAIEFLEGCKASGPPLSPEDAAAYFVFLENGLVREAPGELHAAALGALLAASAGARPAFTASYAPRPALFERLLGHVDPGARDAAGRLLGILAGGMNPAQVQRLVESAVETVNASAEGKRPRFEEADGATAALGYVAATLVTGETSGVSHSTLDTALAALRAQLDSSSPEAALRAAAALALGAAALPLGEPGTHAVASLPEAPAIIASVASLLEDKDPKVAKKAAQALGFLAYGHRSSEALGPAVEALLNARACKVEPVVFSVGEALCLAFGGVGARADDMLRRPFASLADLSDSDLKKNVEDSGDVMPMEEGGEGAPGAPPRDEAEAEAQRRILAAILEECVVHSRPEVRCSGAVWLVSLLLLCSRSQAVRNALPAAQDALTALLGDESELTQEMASRGLSAAYELADDSTRAALVDSLVDVLSGAAGGARKRRAGDLTGETKVFEAGAIGTAPGGGSLSTYKEICSLANDLGQPDLVYRFLSLANAQAAANASRGAAFGFASVAKLAGDALAPHVASLVPRLYRGRYDPQPRVRDAMEHIWTALIDDSREALTANFSAVVKALVSDMTGSQWRAREAAAAAAADLIQGRRWAEVGPHFESLWEAAFRVMDDVKESVRQAGMTLARCLRGLTLRLVDSELTPPAEGRAAVGVALPLLLRLGLPSRVPEVQALAVDTVARVIQGAGAVAVRDHLSTVVPSLLESLSGLEDARLNYVEQHAERLGLDAGKLESARVAAAQGGALGDALDACGRALDGESFAALAPALAGLIRRGVGLNTRAGAGRFVSATARRLGPAAAAAAPPLMRALQEAAAAERSPAVRRAYASANAVLAGAAPSARVDKSVAEWLSTASNPDSEPSKVACAGLLLRSLAREAGDVFSRYAADVAPLAYVAQFDPDAEVAGVWADVWEESTTSVGAGLRLHAGAVVDRVLAGLRAGQWARKRAAAAAAAAACGAAGDTMGSHALKLMEALLAELPGRLWEGKEAVLTAVGAAAAGCPTALRAADPALPGTVVGALLEAAGKKKAVYRREALVQLKRAIEAWGSEQDFLPSVAPPLLALASEFSAAAAASERPASATGSAAGDEKPPGVPIIEVMGCLGAAWATATTEGPQGAAWADEGASAAAAVLAAATKPPEQSAALEAAAALVKRCAAIGAPLDPGAAGAGALLHATAKAATDAKSAALREAAVGLLGAALEAGWPLMDAAARQKWKSAVDEIESSEKVPSVRSVAAQAAAKLATL